MAHRPEPRRASWMPAVIAAADTRLRQIAPARARRRRHDHRRPIRPPPAHTPSCSPKITGEAPTVVLSDDPAPSERISRVLGRHQPLDGRGAHGVRRRRRAPAGRRGVRHERVDAAVLRAGDRPLRPVAPPRARPRASSCRRYPTCCSLGQRDGGPAQPRPRQAAPGERRPTTIRRDANKQKDEPSELDNSVEHRWAPTPSWIR